MLCNNLFTYGLIPEIYLSISFLSVLTFSLVYLRGNFKVENLLISKVIGLVTINFLIYFALLVLNVKNISLNLILNMLMKDELNLAFVIISSLILILSFVYILQYIDKNSLNEFEVFLVILLVFIGSLTILNSNNLIIFYIGLELQSLGLYILASFKTNSLYATEAGLKYFILGAVASCFLLFGISLVYGSTGLLNFQELSLFFSTTLEHNNLVLNSGLLLIGASLIFKVGGVPFHFWVPDVYTGVSLIITFFFSIFPKLAVFYILLKCNDIFVDLPVFSNFLLFSGIFSVILGALGGLYQITIKRLLSYSAISHSGFLLLSYGINNGESTVICLFYLVIYLSLLIALFGILLQCKFKDTSLNIKLIPLLSYLLNFSPILCFSLVFTIFSMMGIPPLSGFFAKLSIFYTLLSENYISTALLIILFSVIGAVYYLRLIRTINLKQGLVSWVSFLPFNVSSLYIIVYLVWFNIFFLLFTNVLYLSLYNLILEYQYYGV